MDFSHEGFEVLSLQLMLLNMKFPTLSGRLRNSMRFIYYWEFSRYGVALWDGVLHPQFSEELRASPYPAAC